MSDSTHILELTPSLSQVQLTLLRVDLGLPELFCQCDDLLRLGRELRLLLDQLLSQGVQLSILGAAVFEESIQLLCLKLIVFQQPRMVLL